MHPYVHIPAVDWFIRASYRINDSHNILTQAEDGNSIGTSRYPHPGIGITWEVKLLMGVSPVSRTGLNGVTVQKSLAVYDAPLQDSVKHFVHNRFILNFLHTCAEGKSPT